ncbi:hypothetical protein IEC97_11770 [Neobacillus cucumis]|uniref:hypothetical protein n=1 Tax=Neobacillus cucumis TaxID=1740721 RepID=UPI0018DF3563|nr:hypothetical protein [Neobacillus cucumis]MBI0578037.1 hypothetical protein [Neobacillus cucumis]
MEANRDSLEQLMESLIKMVGKANQKVDSLQRRVIQLETFIKEEKERGTIRIYAEQPQESASSTPHIS